MKKEEKPYKAVFRARIDFNHAEPYQESLHPGGVYYLNKRLESEVSYDDIANEAGRIIVN